MNYVKFTYVDSITGIPVGDSPATNGPSFPDTHGLQFDFALESKYPTPVAIMYGTCPQDCAGTVGVIGVITELQFNEDKVAELLAREELRLSQPQAEEDLFIDNDYN